MYSYGNISIDISRFAGSTPHIGNFLTHCNKPGIHSGTKGCPIAEKIDRLYEIGFSLPILSDQVYYRSIYIQRSCMDVTEIMICN